MTFELLRDRVIYILHFIKIHFRMTYLHDYYIKILFVGPLLILNKQKQNIFFLTLNTSCHHIVQ